MTELYAIFHKPTGKYMPARMFENSRAGWTWWEPTGANGYGGFDPEVPRLFSKKGSAIQAMGYWLNGNYSIKYNCDPDCDGKLRNTTPQIPRNPKDMEIHVITLAVTRVI